MPARTNGSTVTAVPSKRFELPVLDFKFGSLTEGTDIPPPLPSPIQEERPKTPVKEDKEAANGNGVSKSSEAQANGNHTPESMVTTSTKAGVKRPADDAPVSPTLSNRQGSIRRLFSRNLLNAQYEQDGQSSIDGRPTSQSNGSVMTEKQAKRSSWFRRIRGDDTSSKRSSRIFEEPKKPAGPPPPMIPELSALESKVDVNDGGFGSDLFKNIK
ncbi:hypothetical protein UCRPA7_4866 [Phaeoacremonium minimum UCRPA7]|uniref:Uncharacterized protein n=1 Tax=Phaeoacremonium minimum (strain UCR-PA7) TaxID=1286976 RepID=R8BJR8_PHAM7|nr:hypothetical protein UCRPA7_4866 [Phaeoacremonium minimum UCRPA7]EON99570.1 hypothetical protein UCRPA7_4866 [Phaeoacremonium minimum UCRPA7]